MILLILSSNCSLYYRRVLDRLLGAMLGVIMQTPAQSVHTLMLRYRIDILKKI